MGNVCSNPVPVPVPSDAIFSRCLDCSTRRAAYISELKDNVNALEIEFSKLIAARDDVMRRVVLDEQRQMQRLSLVQDWLSRVEEEETAVGELIRDGTQEIVKLCLGGYCYKNCRSSYKLGKKVAKKLQTLSALQRDGAFEVVAERVPEAAVDKRPTEPAIVGLQLTFDKVWRCLVESAGIIGLYGMGGVGKTTLLTQINNKFLDTPNDFDVVIWVVVSKDLQIQRIQETIGKKLGLLDESLKNSSVEENASTIFKILSKKKFVLLLDDIWKRVDLLKVGIPHPSPATASKIVFTTRSSEVCGLMEAEKKFKIECLTEDEAWILFQKKVGNGTLNSHPDILKLAKIVAEECGGLPLALITIGRAMSSKKTPEEWSYAIQVLRRSAFKFSGMEEGVYNLLKFSYDSLSSNKIRLCLLYCSLFPEDYSISKENLIDYWMSEGFLDEDDAADQQNQGYSIVGDLVCACLLEEKDSKENYVKMHDVIRDMALWIACETEKENEHFLVHAGVGLTEAPKIEKWKGVRRMSLMQNKIECLSEVPICTNLLTLFLNDNKLRMISNDFFKFMPFLTVLDLSNNSKLTEVPSGISELVSLHHLNLSMTSIKELPITLKDLVNLKYLSLEYTFQLCIVPRRLISTLSKLQILKMFDCGPLDYNKKAEEDIRLADGGELLVDELLGLKYLNVLDITLRSHRALEGLLHSDKLHSCTRSLSLNGCKDSPTSFNVVHLADLKHLHTLTIIGFENLEELKTEHVGKVQKTREPFRFHSLNTVSIVHCEKLRDLTGLVFVPNLKTLLVAVCFAMREILSAEKLGEVSERLAILNPFKQLQHLRLRSLENLKSICWKALPFPHLKEIFVNSCPELKRLPLDFNSAKGHKIVIAGQKEWWKELQWEDEATQNAFLPCFESYLDD